MVLNFNTHEAARNIFRSQYQIESGVHAFSGRHHLCFVFILGLCIGLTFRGRVIVRRLYIGGVVVFVAWNLSMSYTYGRGKNYVNSMSGAKI